MKKVFYLILTTLLIILAGLWILPVRLSKSEEVLVALPINEVSPLLTNLHQWMNWYTPLQDKKGATATISDSLLIFPDYSIKRIAWGPTRIEVREQKGKQQQDYTIDLLPDSFGFATKLILVQQINAGEWIRKRLGLGNKSASPIACFKQFADDPKRIFGFDMKVKQVTDTLVMTKRVMAANKDQMTTLCKLFDQLRLFAKEHHADLDSHSRPMASFSPAGPDSTTVMAGLPVTQKGSPGPDITYMEMPAKGKMLIGYYTGPYSGIAGLYSQMYHYARRNNLSMVAAVFEKYWTAPPCEGDSLHMTIELFFPIL